MQRSAGVEVEVLAQTGVLGVLAEEPPVDELMDTGYKLVIRRRKQ